VIAREIPGTMLQIGLGGPLETRGKEYRMTDDKSRVALINWDRKGMAGSIAITSREYHEGELC
jgi:hypothetical protein